MNQTPENQMPEEEMAMHPPELQTESSEWFIGRDEAEACRHRLEKRWYRRLIALNIILIVAVLAMLIRSLPSYQKSVTEFSQAVSEAVLATMGGQDTEAAEEAEAELQEKVSDFADKIPFSIQLFGYGMLVLVVGYLMLYYQYATVRAMSLKITANNFPEVYEMIQTYGKRLGMKKIPDAYVVQQNGVLNAFSAFIPRRQYILINSEIFEVAYREHHDMDSLGFIIAHEMAHIYYEHATLHYNLPIWFVMNFPLFGAIASRCREYSCDRLAQHITRKDGMDAMFLLVVDRHLYKDVDKQDYLNTTANERGFFLWLVNLLSTHPIMTKRIRALAQMQGSGELY